MPNGIEQIENTLIEASRVLATIYTIPADGMTIYQAVQFGKMTERLHKSLDKNISYTRLQQKANSY